MKSPEHAKFGVQFESDWLSPTDPSQFFRRNDPSDLRLINFTSFGPRVPLSNKPATLVLGYPDDQGIALNGGRVGAALGPQEIRKTLYKMTPHLLSVDAPQIFDIGDLKIDEATDLVVRHERGKDLIRRGLAAGHRMLTLGGGHDYGFADGAGFLEHAETIEANERPLVINFDAHLDVRPVGDRGLNSGTPFFRLLENYDSFDFLEVGIQSQCNSKTHFEWAQRKGARLVTWDDWQASGLSLLDFVLRVAEPWVIPRRKLWISCDIDAFASTYAPGCSQSWPTGLAPAEFFETLDFFLARMDVPLLSIYEVAPPLDPNGTTVKLAALIGHRFLTVAGGGMPQGHLKSS